ncbi:MAG: efflux RND transporter periplasmic adaptor subunit [Marinifilaceae bacterium]
MRNFHYTLVIILFTVIGCKGKQNNQEATIARPVQVMYAQTMGTVNKTYVGSVQATQFSELAFKVSGQLITLNVDAGQTVKKGQLIASIDPYDFNLKVNTAQAQYIAAKQIYERTQNLYNANAVAKQNLESAQADYIQATSALNFAKNTLSNTKLLAPFDGFIENKYVENHEVIQVGQKIVKLVNPESVEIRFILPESSIMIMDLPKTIYVEFETIKGKLFLADIKENIYASDGSGIPVTLKVTDAEFNKYRKDVFTGFSCKVYIKIDNNISDSFIVPTSSIITQDGKQYIWIVDKSTLKVHKQEVNAKIYATHSVVQSGLHSNDIIVTAGGQELKDNQVVSILKQN